MKLLLINFYLIAIYNILLKIKLRSSGKKLTPFVSGVVTDGKVQKAFAEKIGHPVGACVKAGVKKGMRASDIRATVARCAKEKAGTKLL